MAELQPSNAPLTPRPTEDETTPLAERTLPPHALGELRYRVVRLHVEGGLGEVHVAEDTELGRAVALKRIKAEYRGDAGSVRRFLREAEITASLEHPGMVPVHGLVHDEHGQPAYAMRFIEGETLKEVCERYHQARAAAPGERRLAFRQLLSHFVAACNAVAYAHSKGIIHRDLKPSNILLGQFGETLVVDWGLAKKVGRVDPGKTDLDGVPTTAEEPPSDATMMGQAVGTPAYMAPEQATGRWDVVGPAADIYSLGATLHHLLTGRPPFQGKNKFEVLALVQQGALVPPRQVNTEVPAALDAVCRKAMAMEPGQRYATASELAREVERWLADEPIGAYRDPWTVRFARWARRHRTAVVATAVFLVSAVAALAVGAGLIWHEERRTAALKQHAVQEWARAEANLDLARELRKGLLDIAEKQLAAVPRAEGIRKGLIDTTLQTVRSALQQRPNDPELRLWTAQLYRYSANMHRRLNQFEVADQAYRQSLLTLDGLVAEDPARRLYRDQLAETLRDHSQLLERIGKYRDAASVLRRSVEIAEGLRSGSAERADYRRTLATSLLALSGVEYAQGHFPTSLQSGQQASELFRDLRGAPPDQWHPLDPLLFVISLIRLGVARRELGNLDDALEAHSEALKQLRTALKQGSNNDYQHFLGRALLEQGRTLTQVPDRLTQAEGNFSEAIRIWADLQKRSPQTLHYREYQALAYEARAQVLAATKHSLPAGEDLDKSRIILETLIGQSPDVPGYRGHLGRTYAAFGRLALARGDATGAADWLMKASRSLNGSLDAAPEDAIDRRSLGEVQADLRRLQTQMPVGAAGADRAKEP